MLHRLLIPALFLMLVPLLASPAQDDDKKAAKLMARFGFDYLPSLYPQKTPKEAMASIVKAIDARRVDYLLAQLADPNFVDTHVTDYKSLFPSAKDEARTFLAFDKLVGETAGYFTSDPVLVRDMRVFARNAEWEVNDDVAVGSVKTIPARKVFLRHIGERWFLQNKQQ